VFPKCKFGSRYQSKWFQKFAYLHYDVEKHAVLCQVLSSCRAMPSQVLQTLSWSLATACTMATFCTRLSLFPPLSIGLPIPFLNELALPRLSVQEDFMRDHCGTVYHVRSPPRSSFQFFSEAAGQNLEQNPGHKATVGYSKAWTLECS